MTVGKYTRLHKRYVGGERKIDIRDAFSQTSLISAKNLT